MADGGGPGSVDFITHASRIPLQLNLAAAGTYPHPGRIIFADREVNTPDRNHSNRGRVPQLQESIATRQYARIQARTGKHHWGAAGATGGRESAARSYQVTVVGADNRAQLRTVEVGRESWPALGDHIWAENRENESLPPAQRSTKWRSCEPKTVQRNGGALIMASFFIRRPIVAIVIAILTVVVGAISIALLPIAQFPNIAPAGNLVAS